LYKEIFRFFLRSIKNINTLCGQKVEFMNY